MAISGVPTVDVPTIDALLVHESEMAARVRAFDWASTSLGPPSAWPQTLQVALGICLHSRFPMFVWWGPELINIYNDAYAPVLGKRHPQALGRPAREVWGEIWPVLGPQVQSVMQDGEATWNERVLLEMERNGFLEDTWFTWSYSPIPDGKGGIGGLFCACTEETGQVRAEAERDRLAEQRRLALDSAQLGWWHLDPESGDVIWDERAKEIFGIPGERLEYSRAMDLIHPNDRERVDQAVRAATRPEAPHPYAIEYRVVHPDGSIHWVFASGQAYYSGQGKERRHTSFVGVIADIDDRKKAEEKVREALETEQYARNEAERVSRMKDEFLATLSHELRTPLNAILGWSNLLSTGRLRPDDLRQAAQTIERNARSQNQLIEDLLDMSRIISGKVRLDVQRVDLADVVSAAIDSALPTATSKGVCIEKAIESGVGIVNGDSARLQQVVWNLLSNAIKFTPAGGRVRMSLEQVASQLELRVSDSGIGIVPDFLPHVFDRFTQADSGSTRQHGGLGLGLSIVKQIIEMHNGTVRAHSPGVGGGSTFIVTLPAANSLPADNESQGARGANSLRAPFEVAPKLTGLKVLVVDDEPDARELVRYVLRGAGAEVVTAGSAEEGVALIESERPGMIVSDIGMPGVDGYGFIQRVRALEKSGGGDTPAIALTAFARSEDRRRVLLSGYQSHVSKPMEAAELITVVASLAGRVTPGES